MTEHVPDNFDFSDEADDFDFAEAQENDKAIAEAEENDKAIAEAEENDKAIAFLFDDPRTPAPPALVVERQRDPRFRQLAADVRALPMRKKLFLRFLMANQMHMGRAIKAMSEKLNLKLDKSSIYRWARDDMKFKKIIEAYETLALEQAGIGSPVVTLLRIDSIVEDALVPVPRIVNGDPVYVDGKLQMEVDRGNALKGLEMIGKSQGVFRKDEENQQRVTVILDFSGEKEPGAQEGEIIDGEFQEIKRGS